MLFNLLQGLTGKGMTHLAYSGGLDSRFLGWAMSSAGLDVVLWHVRGPHVPGEETSLALSRAEGMKCPIHVLTVNPLDIPEVRANGRERCYFCKRMLFSRIMEAIQQRYPTRKGDTLLCDGSNFSDREGYRPGLRALAELGVRSPLAEAGLDKAEIRRLAAAHGLEAPHQPSRPCLLTRFAYGLEPSLEMLALVNEVETVTASVLKDFRETGHGKKPVGEVPVPDFRIRLSERGLLLQVAAARNGSENRDMKLFMACLENRLTTLGLPVPELLHSEQVSGYFDRHA